MYRYHGILQSYMLKYEVGVIIGIEGCDTNEGNRIYTYSYGHSAIDFAIFCTQPIILDCQSWMT